MTDEKLIQVYCTHCGTTLTMTEEKWNGLRHKSCRLCLQGELKPVAQTEG